MKTKIILLALSVAAISALNAQQAGINTKTPKATLDVVGSPATTTLADGVIAPRITRANLIAKAAAYASAQTGAIVFVSDLSGTTGTSTAAVTAVGYYYFDGTNWVQFAPATILDYARVARSRSTTSPQVVTTNSYGGYSAANVIDFTKGSSYKQGGLNISGNTITVPAGLYEIEYSVYLNSSSNASYIAYIGNGSASLMEEETSINANAGNISLKYVGSFSAAANIDFRITSSAPVTTNILGFHVSVKKL